MIVNMKDNKKRNENSLMIILALMSFAIGIWENYRQLWLESIGFNIVNISRIYSVALICSSIISFIISIFSSKIKIKSIISLSIVFRIISLLVLLFTKDTFTIKVSFLLCIMSDIIFSISFYPLLTYITKTEESFKKKTLIEYFARDIGIVSCGLLIGVYIGKYLFNYETCLIISLIISVVAFILLFRFKSNERHHHNVVDSFKLILKKKVNRVFLYNQVIIKISYGVVFSLLMLILVNYINFDVSIASVYIIVCNVIGSFLALIFTKIGKNFTTTKSAIVKFGSRIMFYLLAFIFHNKVFFILALTIGNVTSRMLEEKITAPFLKDIKSDDQFLFSNFRYLSLCLGEGIGAFLAGILIIYSLKYLFLGAIIFTIIQIIIYSYMDKLRKEE